MNSDPNKLVVRKIGAPEVSVIAPSDAAESGAEFVVTVHPFPGSGADPRALHLGLSRGGLIEMRNAIDLVLAHS